MSIEADTQDGEADAQQYDNPQHRIAELEDQLDHVTERMEAAVNLAQDARQEVTRVREQRREIEEHYEDRIEELQDQIDELRDRTEIFKKVQDASGLDMDQRAAICIQTAYNAAQNDPNDTAYLTVQEGWKALNCSIDRTRLYDVYNRAEELVGDDDVCYYKEEDRGHQPPSRLIVDLSEGRLPSRIEGVDIKGGSD